MGVQLLYAAEHVRSLCVRAESQKNQVNCHPGIMAVRLVCVCVWAWLQLHVLFSK